MRERLRQQQKQEEQHRRENRTALALAYAELFKKQKVFAKEGTIFKKGGDNEKTTINN